MELDAQQRDRYGRMVNQVLVEEGCVQVMTVPPNGRYAGRFLEAEQADRAVSPMELFNGQGDVAAR